MFFLLVASEWLIGDGSGTEVQVGSAVASREACYQLCVDKKKNDSSINGATFGVSTGSRSGHCYCASSMMSVDGDNNWVSRYIPGNLYFLFYKLL